MISAQGGSVEDGAGTPGPRQERREHTRDALLGAAARLWAERGINGASLDDVAAAAGLTKGAVYSNFTGKTDLLLALLERSIQSKLSGAVIDALRDAERPLEERLERAGAAHGEWMDTDEARLMAMLRMEFWLYGMRDYAAGWRLADWYEARRGRLADELTDTDDLTASDRAVLAIALETGLTAQRLIDPDRVSADLYTKALRLVLGPALPQP